MVGIRSKLYLGVSVIPRSLCGYLLNVGRKTVRVFTDLMDGVIEILVKFLPRRGHLAPLNFARRLRGKGGGGVAPLPSAIL